MTIRVFSAMVWDRCPLAKKVHDMYHKIIYLFPTLFFVLNLGLARLSGRFLIIETFSYRVFRDYRKPQPSKYHVTLALPSRLTFAVPVFTVSTPLLAVSEIRQFQLGKLNLTTPRLWLNDWFLRS